MSGLYLKSESTPGAAISQEDAQNLISLSSFRLMFQERWKHERARRRWFVARRVVEYGLVEDERGAP